MLVDGPLVKNDSNPFLVMQMRTWRACYFQEWMLEMNVNQLKDDGLQGDGQTPLQAQAGAKYEEALALAVGRPVAQAVITARVDSFCCNINGTDLTVVLKGW